MKFYRISAISLLLTVCVACATNENSNVTSNVTKATSYDSEKVLVSKEVQQLAKTDISNKELGEKLVCKTVQKTGSQFKTKVCRTKKEVKNERTVAQDELDKIRRGTPITSN